MVVARLLEKSDMYRLAKETAAILLRSKINVSTLSVCVDYDVSKYNNNNSEALQSEGNFI